MGRNSRWVEGRAEESAQHVAHRALKTRIERMWHYLESAVRAPQSDTENVHQLRVFSRRTAAAMDIFAAWLPRRRGQWLRKQVKRIRKAAGEARDFDVLLLRWSAHVDPVPPSQDVLILDEIKKHREKAQEPIEMVHKKLRGKRFVSRTAKVLERVRHHEGGGEAQRFGQVARESLRRLVVPYLDAADAQLDDARALHAFRIQGKQVRYAMEIFAGAFDESFRQELYPLVATLQDRLGAINDRVTAHAHFDQWRNQAREVALQEALALAVDREQQSLETIRREFLEWWTAERRQGLHSRFAPYLQFDVFDVPNDRENCA